MKDLEMAKKRDHKILITDKAIKKVPLVQYKEIPESEYLMLQELAKEVLTVSKNDNDSNEVALTYSLDYQNAVSHFYQIVTTLILFMKIARRYRYV